MVEQQTKIAVGVQATIVSRQGTAIAQQAENLAQQAAQLTQIADQQSQITDIPVDTEEPQATITQATAPITSSILLDKWEIGNWVSTKSSICKDSKLTCYQILMSGQKSGSITTKESLLIDNSWSNPYLVFWTKYITKANIDAAFGYVEVESPGSVGWSYLKGFSGTRQGWYKEAIPLTDYKDQAIRIRFYAEYADRTQNWDVKPHYEWYVQTVQIIPNYVAP